MAVALSAGPSRWGRPQSPVKAVVLTINLGSPSPEPSEISPDGFLMPWMVADVLMYSLMTDSRSEFPPINSSTKHFRVRAESLVQVYQSGKLSDSTKKQVYSSVLQLGSVLLGLATTTPSLMPSENAPLAPMLFKTPCKATGVSFDRNESNDPVARGTKPDVAWAMPRRPNVARAAAMTEVLATRDICFL